jgi:hypothetical protein
MRLFVGDPCESQRINGGVLNSMVLRGIGATRNQTTKVYLIKKLLTSYSLKLHK